jgi:hypothetical protein
VIHGNSGSLQNEQCTTTAYGDDCNGSTTIVRSMPSRFAQERKYAHFADFFSFFRGPGRCKPYILTQHTSFNSKIINIIKDT